MGGSKSGRSNEIERSSYVTVHFQDFSLQVLGLFESWPVCKMISGFGERVDTFFSLRIWHHAGRPTTGHSAETIGTMISL